MTPVAATRRWADQLPRSFARQLAEALRAGPAALEELRHDVVLPVSAAAVRAALEFSAAGDGPFTAGLLTGRLDAIDQQPQVTPVWTGPDSPAGHGRLTLAVIADLIDEAQDEIVIASYATAPGDAVRAALEAAVARDVALTLLLERNSDNPSFRGSNDPLSGLKARRLAWPIAARPLGAAMHAKVLVVDRRVALVGSANLTGHALERNLECGLLVRGGDAPRRLAEHLLAAQGLEEVDT